MKSPGGPVQTKTFKKSFISKGYKQATMRFFYDWKKCTFASPSHLWEKIAN